MLRYILMYMMALVFCQNALAQSDRQLIRNGNQLYRKQDYAKAEVEYRKALGQNSRNTQAMYNLGCALMVQQKDSAAIVQFENAGKNETAKKRKAMVYHNIGVVCQNHQMYGEAIEAYKESLRNNPTDHETRYNLALCLRQKKQQDKNGGGKNNQKDKDKKNQQKQDKKEQQKDQQKQQEPQEQMSKENAEQMLNYAVQAEKATQQRMKQQQSQPQQRRLQKNW